MNVIEEKGGCVLLRVRVQPRASRNAIRVEPDGRIRVALTAPPADGTANASLCSFLAKILSIPKTAVSLSKGERSRDKVLCLANMAADEVRRRVRAAQRPSQKSRED